MEENRFYYIDEAGCLTLFDKYGKVIVGNKGVSKTFILGMAWIEDIFALEESFKNLRANLMQDSVLSQVPSMRPEARKTALAFHANKDCHAVRHRVFELLQTVPCKVFIAFRRKSSFLFYASLHKSVTGKYYYPTHQVYDNLTSRIMTNLLHKADCQIVFSKRGKTSRQNELSKAVRQAAINYENKFGITNERNIEVQVAAPHEFAGLQLIDYYLWALQRLLERREDKYFNLLQDNYRLIMDLDDETNNAYGTWYNSDNPLSLDIIKPI